MLGRRQFLRSSAFAGLLAAAGLPSSASASGRPWNVLVVSSDEHNPRFLSHLGHAVATPNLDRLASEGLSLDRTYTASPVCAPTRASFLTSLWPQEHGQTNNGHVLDAGHYTLAEFFRDQGYRTACFGKLHTNNDESEPAFGFQDLLTFKSGARWKEAHRRHAAKGGAEGAAWVDARDERLFTGGLSKMLGKVQRRLGQNRDFVLLEEARAWLDRHQEQPFFLYASFQAPHYPFSLPEHFYRLYDPARLELPSSVGLEELRERSPAAAASLDRYAWHRLGPEQVRVALARYMGSVSFLDWLVGELLGSLEAAGRAHDTLVLYVSDHGDQAGEQGLWLKSVMFEGANRKPAILRMPGKLEAGSRTTQPVNEVDLLPTLAGLVGLGDRLPRGALSGRDLSGDLLSGRAHSGLAYTHLGIGKGERPWQSMAVGERFKLVRTMGAPPRVRCRELYDLEEDPGERVNLASRPEARLLVEELEADLERHLAALQTTSSAT